MNRARLFLHELQCDVGLKWDSKLGGERLREWSNIVKQVNNSPVIKISRSFGNRDDVYELHAYSDSSSLAYGVVLFLHNTKTAKSSFMYSKNRLVNKQLQNKKIPSLELQAVVLAAEELLKTYNELTDKTCVVPIKVSKCKLFTDSAVCIGWLNSYFSKYDKMNKISVFVHNRLKRIATISESITITAYHCAGKQNPADCVTRTFSYNQLMKSNYFEGLDAETLNSVEGREDIPSVTIPNSHESDNTHISHASVESVTKCTQAGPIVDVNRFSSFTGFIKTYKAVFKFIHILKERIGLSNDSTSTDKAFFHAIREYQRQSFSEIFNYYDSPPGNRKDIPLLMSQLNVFMSSEGILRVKCKLKKWRDAPCNFPILLDRESRLTEILILETHENMNHAGVYSVLSELRHNYWITRSFSSVKRYIKKCIVCRRFNRRTVKVNQNEYRDFRLNPPDIPFRFSFIDHLGPFTVNLGGKNVKIYLLIITCMWSRACNLKICLNLTVDSFLRALQMHIYEYGCPSLILSDLGSSFVRGGEIVTEFLKDSHTVEYFKSHGITQIKFEQYPKGRNELGGIVEICVKMVKRLVYGSIRNLIIDYFDFEFLTAQVTHLVNRRPIGFKDALRDESVDHEIPCPITPEILLKGHELISVNIVPELQGLDDVDQDWHESPVDKKFEKLKKARKYLNEIYNGEFLSTLIKQATDSKTRYQPVKHTRLSLGDLVLMKE